MQVSKGKRIEYESVFPLKKIRDMQPKQIQEIKRQFSKQQSDSRINSKLKELEARTEKLQQLAGKNEQLVILKKQLEMICSQNKQQVISLINNERNNIQQIIDSRISDVMSELKMQNQAMKQDGRGLRLLVEQNKQSVAKQMQQKHKIIKQQVILVGQQVEQVKQKVLGITNVMEQFRLKNSTLQQKMVQAEQALGQIRQDYQGLSEVQKQAEERLTLAIRDIRMQNQNKHRQANDRMDKLNDAISDKVVILQKEYALKLKEQVQRIEAALQALTVCTDKLEKNSQQHKQQLDRLKYMELVNSDTPYAQNFTINRKSITKNKGNGWHQLLFTESVPQHRVYTFAIGIVKTATRYIMIGVVRSSRAKQQISQSSGESICYYGSGYKYPGGIKQGNGFAAGELVVVRVDRPSCTVQWSVDGKVRATHTLPMLKQDVEFVPYIETLNEGDTVEWQGSSVE